LKSYHTLKKLLSVIRIIKKTPGYENPINPVRSVCVVSASSQSPDSVLIRGQIISKDKQPLPSATIRVSHTDNVVFSDATGQLEIWSPVEGILEFSCISEPYKISLSSIDAGKKEELLRFEFDLRL
jgi:hypothetical protein